MDFAILKDSTVIEIVGIFPTNWQQFEEVVVCNRNVRKGDKYIMGYFYRNGERVPTPEEESYLAEINDMKSALERLGVE